MKEKTFQTRCGNIRYWVTESIDNERPTLMFLPGLTADHRLFDRQIDYFEPKYNVFVWDAPAHAASRPFRLDFTLMDKAKWLNGIIEAENIQCPVIVGQSMGGCVAQAYAQLYPGALKGVVSIDSCPLQRKYTTALDLWLLRRMEPIYRMYPWKALLKAGSKGVAVTPYGIALMRDMMLQYDGDPREYAKLVGHGYRMLADAIAADLNYRIDCSLLLICGEKDRAGYSIRYNRSWSRDTGISVHWIENAGHNSNSDRPDIVNALIGEFVEKSVLSNR